MDMDYLHSAMTKGYDLSFTYKTWQYVVTERKTGKKLYFNTAEEVKEFIKTTTKR